jgi:hypothetical protein
MRIKNERNFERRSCASSFCEHKFWRIASQKIVIIIIKESTVDNKILVKRPNIPIVKVAFPTIASRCPIWAPTMMTPTNPMWIWLEP